MCQTKVLSGTDSVVSPMLLQWYAKHKSHTATQKSTQLLSYGPYPFALPTLWFLLQPM